jgi:hypothetical protein
VIAIGAAESRLITRAGTVPEGLIARWAGEDCSSFSRLTKTGLNGIPFRYSAMRRRAEQEERKYV